MNNGLNNMTNDNTSNPVNQVSIRDEQGKFVPGVSGNPNGRPPKGYAITDVMREMLNEKPEIKKALSSKLFELALKGDLAAIREVLDRLEGRAKQTLDLGSDPENPLVVIKHGDKS